MKTTLLALLTVLALGCGGGPLDVPPTGDADAPDVQRDAGGDALCTVWECRQSGPHSCTMLCMSYEPQPCPPGPWPCSVDAD